MVIKGGYLILSSTIMTLAQRLEAIGLSEKEAKVYLATLELGDAPVHEISKKANVNRATTYVILEGLLQKAIVSKYEKEKKTHFIAENPISLRSVIREKEELLRHKEHLLQTISPELQSIYNLLPHKPVVRFFEGKEGLKAMQQDFLEGNKSKIVYEIFPYEHVTQAFTEEEVKKNGEKRRLSGIKAVGIYKKVGGEDLRGDEITYLKRLSDDSVVTSDITVYGDEVRFVALKGHLSGVVIESKAIADTLETMFKIIMNCKCSEKKSPERSSN